MQDDIVNRQCAENRYRPAADDRHPSASLGAAARCSYQDKLVGRPLRKVDLFENRCSVAKTGCQGLHTLLHSKQMISRSSLNAHWENTYSDASTVLSMIGCRD